LEEIERNGHDNSSDILSIALDRVGRIPDDEVKSSKVAGPVELTRSDGIQNIYNSLAALAGHHDDYNPITALREIISSSSKKAVLVNSFRKLGNEFLNNVLGFALL